MAELHEQLALSYERELARAEEPLRRIYLQEMIARQMAAAAQHRDMSDRLAG